jgi:hypothetical protein
MTVYNSRYKNADLRFLSHLFCWSGLRRTDYRQCG